MESGSEREWYLQHPVVNPNKPAKVRRVLNGVAKFQGASLNNSLLTGPDLLQNLIYVLVRFRRHPIAISADIEGLFFQLGVLPCDQQLSFVGWSITSIHATPLERRIRPRAPTKHFSARQMIMLRGILMPGKPSLRTSTWMVRFCGIPPRGPSVGRRSWYIFSI